jgi:hypothetical protein
MKTKTINMEGRSNRLIAEFMGYEVNHNKCYSPKYNDGTIAPMQFHKSWDWLMPVVEKIESLGYTFEKNYQPIDKDWQSLIVKGNDILYQEFDAQSIKASYYVVCELITDIIKT